MSNKPDMIKPERYSHIGAIKKNIKKNLREATDITKPIGAGNLGVAAGVVTGTVLSKILKKKKSNVSPPVSKPKFSNVQVPVGKPKQTRKPQTLKEDSQKKPFTRTKSMEGLKRSVIEGINAARDEKLPEGFPKTRKKQ